MAGSAVGLLGMLARPGHILALPPLKAAHSPSTPRPPVRQVEGLVPTASETIDGAKRPLHTG